MQEVLAPPLDQEAAFILKTELTASRPASAKIYGVNTNTTTDLYLIKTIGAVPTSLIICQININLTIPWFLRPPPHLGRDLNNSKVNKEVKAGQHPGRNIMIGTH